ncbi:hypothetical protein ACFLTC_00590 [Chloroflexota bacterium]
MRILVGTLYTIENEFDECIASIKRQSHQDFQIFVLEKLPNKEAHDTLYRTFMDRSDEFDLMIKVDADMVLADDDLFAKIVERFEANVQLKDLEMAVQDFFSDQLIWGMHAYRNTVEWQPTGENLFVDACSLGEGERIHDDSELAPAAIHCKNPSPFQAFRYGVHRALKAIQPGRPQLDQAYSTFQWSYLQKTRRNFRRTKDRRIGLAVLAAELAFAGKIRPGHYDYSHPFLETLFQRYAHLDASQLERKIRRLSLSSFGFLPSGLRRGMLVRVARGRI